jgi:ubiquitin carboxyl-terminal hydrolase 36/42
MGAILMFYCQVKCIQCMHESNRYEPMMDLLVDIQNNVKSVEDALAQFTDTEL